MILDSTTPEERPRLQGGLIATRFFAAMATSIGFGLWLKQTGNGPGHGDGVIWAVVGLGLIPLVLQACLREPPKRGHGRAVPVGGAGGPGQAPVADPPGVRDCSTRSSRTRSRST